MKLYFQIKDNRRADKITSGPQSHILEGVSWEEAKKLQVSLNINNIQKFNVPNDKLKLRAYELSN